nr:uncharacterized protein LOC697570 isoform X4 [Macaca mulatta]
MKGSLAITVLPREGSVGPPTPFNTCVWTHPSPTPENKASFSVCAGPADIRIVWEKNGRALETCVPVQTHALPDGSAHALSWLQDAIRESTEYRCSVISSAGNKTSKVQVAVMRPVAHQEKWSRELSAWRAVAGEHDRMMQSWRKAWESCSKDTL